MKPHIMMSFFLYLSLGSLPSLGMTRGSCHLECLIGTLHYRKINPSSWFNVYLSTEKQGSVLDL